MQFEKIKDENFVRIAALQRLTEYNGSEYSMLYLKGWDFFNYPSMEFSDCNDKIFIRFRPHDKYKEDVTDGKYIYLPPLTTSDKIAEAYGMIEDQCREDGDIMYVMSTPKEYVDILGDRYEYVFNEDYSEYLYAPSDLIDLRGKKYHSKRNHIANFVRKYKSGEGSDCVFRPYVHEDRKGVLSLIDGWEESKDFDSEEFDGMADDELSVIALALKFAVGREEYFADVVECGGRIIGFSFGEITPSGVGITHIEKGDVNYDGVYPYLCNAFASAHFADVRYINRQEDMGLEGLRRSKRSYHPVAFCEKYAVKIKG